MGHRVKPGGDEWEAYESCWCNEHADGRDKQGDARP